MPSTTVRPSRKSPKGCRNGFRVMLGLGAAMGLVLPVAADSSYYGCIPEGSMDRVNEVFAFSTKVGGMTSAKCTAACGKNIYALINAAYNGAPPPASSPSSSPAVQSDNPPSNSLVNQPSNSSENPSNNNNNSNNNSNNSNNNNSNGGSTPSNVSNGSSSPQSTSKSTQPRTGSEASSDNSSGTTSSTQNTSKLSSTSIAAISMAGCILVAAIVTFFIMRRQRRQDAKSPSCPENGTGLVDVELVDGPRSVSPSSSSAGIVGNFFMGRKKAKSHSAVAPAGPRMSEDRGELGKASSAKLRMLMIQPSSTSLGDGIRSGDVIALPAPTLVKSGGSGKTYPTTIIASSAGSHETAITSTTTSSKRSDNAKLARIAPTNFGDRSRSNSNESGTSSASGSSNGDEDAAAKRRRRAPSSIYMEAVAYNVASPVAVKPPSLPSPVKEVQEPSQQQKQQPLAFSFRASASVVEQQRFTPLGRAESSLHAVQEEDQQPVKVVGNHGRSKYAALVAARIGKDHLRVDSPVSTFVDHGSSVMGSSVIDHGRDSFVSDFSAVASGVPDRILRSDTVQTDRTGFSSLRRPELPVVRIGNGEAGAFFGERFGGEGDLGKSMADTVLYSYRSGSTLDMSRSGSPV
ncbi:hypothetical protein HDU97_006988 [Phlyctochytrium planicorne]|nr:hypothetical protein HDU97_006988 [Phlyctochytrium planicorne]